MGTGVGEAALAAEAIGAAEAAGAIGGGAGFLEGMAGVSALEGAGVAGLGLGTGAGLGTGLAGAGGLGALSPAFQTALGETAVFNPEIAAQTAQFANVGALPSANAALGAGQIGDPALLNEAYRAASTASNIPGLTEGVQPLQAREALPSIDKFQNIAAQGFNTPVATTLSESLPAANPLDFGAGTAEASKFPFSNPLTSLYKMYKDQDPLTQGVMKYGGLGLGGLQLAKYLNKQPGVAPAEKYSGPLSKFTYSPDTYRPYTYKPYAAGGPVEEMSRENAIGANTGYPQSDIQQGAYATPWQTPVSRNVVANAGDVGVDQMTGMERMARGGAVRYADGGLYSDPNTNRYIDPNANVYGDPNSAPSAGSERASNAPATASAPGQGISGLATAVGLGLMGIAENAPPGIAAGIANAIGSGIAGNQTDAMGNAMSALSAMSGVPGISTVSDANGNVTGISSPASIAAADAAAGLTGDAASDGDSGGDGGGDGGGFADGGLADLGAFAQSLPAVLASRQNFADFLARYQNLPITEAAPAPTTYTGLYAGTARPGDNISAYDQGPYINPGDMGTPGGSTGARAGGLMHHMAMGGMATLGGYSDGGRLLKGPGDGMSDNIPATIGRKQPARLADGEFVVPADVVSGLGNGSTDAGAKQLYKMLDKVRAARTGTKKQGKQIKPEKYTPA